MFDGNCPVRLARYHALPNPLDAVIDHALQFRDHPLCKAYYSTERQSRQVLREESRDGSRKVSTALLCDVSCI